MAVADTVAGGELRLLRPLVRERVACREGGAAFAGAERAAGLPRTGRSGTVAAGEGFPVAILNRNAPAFYCVPAKVFEEMTERLEDLELNALADARAGQPVVKVSLDDL